MYTSFRQAFVYILSTKSKELCQLNFVYKMYTNVCRNVGYILHTNILYTFCIHQFWCTKSVHHKHYVYNLYTKFIQIASTNNCMQNGSLISTCFDPFVVHFLVSHCKQLRLETCWLITGIPIKLMDYWIIHCIKLPVIKMSKSKSPWASGKKRQICAAGELANLWMWLKWTFWLDQLANYFPERHFFFFFFFFFFFRAWWPIWHASSK